MTLIELMVGLAIAGILLVAAAPMFGDYIVNSRLREGGNLLFSETLIAQSEAIKRNTRIMVSTTATVVQLLDVTDPVNPVVLRERTLPGGVTMAADTITFAGDGRQAGFPVGATVAIDLGSTTTTCSTEARCPGLRVDVGGSVQLCRDHTGTCP